MSLALTVSGCDAFCGSDCKGGVIPVRGDPSALSLTNTSTVVRITEPVPCEPSPAESGHAFSLELLGTQDPDGWVYEQFVPALEDAGIPVGWGLARCDEDAVGIQLRDWNDTNLTVETAAELGMQSDVHLLLSIELLSIPIACPDAIECGL